MGDSAFDLPDISKRVTLRPSHFILRRKRAQAQTRHKEPPWLVSDRAKTPVVILLVGLPRTVRSH